MEIADGGGRVGQGGPGRKVMQPCWARPEESSSKGLNDSMTNILPYDDPSPRVWKQK